MSVTKIIWFAVLIVVFGAMTAAGSWSIFI
jgi:hypothetical protein